MTLEPGDRLILSMAETGGPYVKPQPDNWWATTDSKVDAMDFALGAPSPEEAYQVAAEAAGAVKGRLIRIPANQLPGGGG